jgi:hypothetical protein
MSRNSVEAILQVAHCTRFFLEEEDLSSDAGQSHESKLLTRLVRIFIAPEAQWWLAPRFSAGKGANNGPSAL